LNFFVFREYEAGSKTWNIWGKFEKNWIAWENLGKMSIVPDYMELSANIGNQEQESDFKISNFFFEIKRRIK
jgi:hypothetical protein